VTPEVGTAYRARVTLPATLTVTEESDASGDALVWGKGPDGATYRLPILVFAAVYGGPEMDWQDRAELTVAAPS
jgi:hypothetical protein